MKWYQCHLANCGKLLASTSRFCIQLKLTWVTFFVSLFKFLASYVEKKSQVQPITKSCHRHRLQKNTPLDVNHPGPYLSAVQQSMD